MFECGIWYREQPFQCRPGSVHRPGTQFLLLVILLICRVPNKLLSLWMKRLIYCVNVSSPDLPDKSVDKPPVAAADHICVMTSDDIPSEPPKSVDKLSAVRAMPCYDVPSEPCSVDKSSDAAMTSEDVYKSVDKPPAAVPSWPRATASGALKGASLINDFLVVPTGSGNNPSLIKAYGLTRSALQKMSPVKFEDVGFGT